MTREENNQLIELLNKKKAEIASSIEFIVDICDDKEMEYEETRHLRNLSRHISASIVELTIEYGAQAIINRINCEDYED